MNIEEIEKKGVREILIKEIGTRCDLVRVAVSSLLYRDKQKAIEISKEILELVERLCK